MNEDPVVVRQKVSFVSFAHHSRHIDCSTYIGYTIDFSHLTESAAVQRMEVDDHEEKVMDIDGAHNKYVLMIHDETRHLFIPNLSSVLQIIANNILAH